MISLTIHILFITYKEKNFILNKEIFQQLSFLFLSIKPICQLVQPLPTEAEPAAGTYLLATKTENEIAVTHLSVRQAGIDEFKMGVAFLMGIGQGCPYRQCTGRQPGKSFAEPEREAEVGTVLGVHTKGTSDNPVLVFDDESTGCSSFGGTLGEQLEKLLMGEVLPHLRGIVSFQELDERSSVCFCGGFRQDDSLSQCPLDEPFTFGVQTFLGLLTV